MRGVAAFVGRYTGLELSRHAGLLRLDGVAQFGRVILVQQMLDRILHEIRIAEVAVAINVRVAHRFDLVVHALSGMEAQVLHRIAFEDIHDLADHHPAGARRWRRDHVIAAIIAFHRGQFASLVFVQVGLADDAFVGLAGSDNGIGDPTFVEAVGALVGNRPQGFRQILLHQFLPDLHRLAVAEEDRAGIAHVLLEHIRRVFEQLDIALLQFETVFGQFDRRGNHLLALFGAVFAQRQLHAGHRTRYADRQVPARAQFRNDVTVLVQIHVGGRCQRRFFAEIEKGLAPVRQLNSHEPAAAKVARSRIDHRQRIAHGHCRIHGIAAVFQNVDADMGRQMLRGDHHAVFRRHRSH